MRMTQGKRFSFLITVLTALIVNCAPSICLQAELAPQYLSSSDARPISISTAVFFEMSVNMFSLGTFTDCNPRRNRSLQSSHPRSEAFARHL